MKMHDLKSKKYIMECTLRDGSYLIDMQFTTQDTKVMARALSKLGFEMIEIGHGVGMNASNLQTRAAATDIEYVRAARSVIGDHSMIGMFCIPGIATLDDIKACADEGLQFVRVGTNMDDVRMMEDYIKVAKERGLMVCANFMKSYAMEPKPYCEIVRIADDFGADAVYLVDSAGGMMPSRIREYISAMKQATDLPIGFHGHNNMALAVANSLVALEEGASIIDTTLMGMGRSSGNVPTEIAATLLRREYGAYKNISDVDLVELADQSVGPIIAAHFQKSEATAMGQAQVHSQYASRIKQSAHDAGKSFFSTVAEVGKRDILYLPDEVMSEAITAAEDAGGFKERFGDVSLLPYVTPSTSAQELLSVAAKKNCPIFLRVDPKSLREATLSRQGLEITCGQEDADYLLTMGAKTEVEIFRS